MKKLNYVIGLVLLWSCSTKNESTDGFGTLEFTFEIDTLLVDSKGEMLMAGTRMFVSDVSKDKKFLYNFDQSSYQVEVIDLDKLALDRKIKLEKEGPDGIENPSEIFDLGNGQLGFTNSTYFTIIDSLGRKISQYRADGMKWDSDSLMNTEKLDPSYLFANGTKEFYTLIDHFNENSTILGLVNFETKSLKKIEIQNLDKLKDFTIQLSIGNASVSNNPLVTLYSWNNQILIGNNAFNEIIVYDPLSESISVKAFESKLTPNQRIPNEKVEMGSIEELIAESKKLNEQIDFGKLNWDPLTQRFYRLSSISLPRPEGVKTFKADVFLAVFDQELNMIGETKVEGYTKPPSVIFFKDGAIWLHENINDELGFIRMKISEK